MKKYLILIGLAAMVAAYAACTKTTDPVFDQTPEQRITAELQKDQSLLTGASSGWKAVLFPGSGRGMGFLFKFNAAGRVQTFPDNLISSALTVTFKNPDTSGYLIKQLQRPSLVFSTYSYLNYLADPVNGTRGQGFLSDNEFSFIMSSTDTILLEGNYNQSQLRLVRASAAEYDAYAKGGIAALSTALTDYLNSASGKTIRLVIDNTHQPVVTLVKSVTERTFKLTYQDDQGKAQELKTRWAIGINSIFLEVPLHYNGIMISEVFYDSVKKSLYINWQGKRYELIVS